MNRRRNAALLMLLCPALAAWAGTLVPEADHIDDRAAALALAETLSWRADTRAEAIAAYEAWVAAHPGDAEAVAALARVETWTGRAAKAAARLEALAGRETLTPAARATLAEAWMQLGRFDEAIPAWRALVEANPGDAAPRRGLALALAWSGRAAEARPWLETLARELPDDREVARALAAMSAGDPAAETRSLALLRERVAREPDNASVKADLADLLAARGHASEARSLYDAAREQVRPRDGDTFDLRHARARLTWGDFYPAETAFRAALAASPGDESLNAELIALLVSMDRLERAEADALRWTKRAPESAKARAALADARRKLRWDPPVPRTAPAAGSLAATFATAGNEETRSEAFIRAYVGERDDVPPPAPAYRLSELAGLYAEQGDFERAIRCFRAARRADPEYFPAWLGLAEFLAIAQHYDEAHREFVALAEAFPGNRQVLLKQARALGWGRRYDDSLAAYERLRALNPADPVPLLEQARVAGWAKRRDDAAALYAERWAEPVDERLWAALHPGETRERPANEEPFYHTERFESDYPELVAKASPEEAAKLEALRLDLRADFHLQRAFWLENRAKQLAWDRRWWRAEETYDRLLAAAPGNQEALFDLSQVQAAQGLGDREHATLDRLLALDANNRLAGEAAFRRERRSAPLVFGQYDFYRERGRDELSAIGRQRTAVGGEATLDHRIKARGALLHWRESPDSRAEDFEARGFMIGAEGVLANWLAVSAEYAHKDNEQSGIGSVDTGGVQAWVSTKDAVRVGAGVEVREELANEFAYFQGIRSTHRWVGAEAALSRRFEVAARFSGIDYADDNRGTDFWVAPAYTWSDHPRTFKTTLTLQARDTDEENVYLFAGPALADITHPYWTPQDYRGVALTFEWRHDLAKDFFIGAQEHWYDVRVTFAASNDDNQGVAWAADYAREWRDRWVLRLGVAQTLSGQWDDFRAHARLAFRF